MIIVIGGKKGGTGKTTTAINLAAMRSLAGKDCLFIDANYQQESGSTWCSIRDESKIEPRITWFEKSNTALNKDLIEFDKRFSDIFVDCGGIDDVAFRSSLVVADYFISPVKPAQFEIWSLGKLDKIVQELKLINPNLQAFIFINAAPTNTFLNDTAQTIEYIKDSNFENIKLLESPIYERRVFKKVVPHGLSVIEYEPKDEKAIAEVKSLYAHIFKD